VDALSLAVLALLLVLTGGLAVYLHVVLPKSLDTRMFESISAFSKAIELRFPSHEGLTERVVPLAIAIGHRVGLSSRRLRDLELAAQLRDIGLCCVPYRLINGRSFVRWTDEEKAIYQQHAETGAGMLEQVPSLRHLARIVRWHHTAHAGNSLPLESRILRVAADYIWCERWQGEVLARTVLEQDTIEYDPKVVEVLLNVLTSSRAAQPAPELASAAR
jgi:response regulator RpfG family c-di-GMP phosphodiesterase